MADDYEDQFNKPFDHLFKVGPIDLAQESDDAWPEENENDTLRAFSDLLHYDKKNEELKTMGSSFGRQLDEALSKSPEPIVPMDNLSSEGAGITGSSMAPIPEDQKQQFFLERNFSPNFQRGTANYFKLVAQAMRLYNFPGGEALGKYADEVLRNTKAREQPSFLDAYKNSKDASDAAKNLWTYVEEQTAEGLGSSAPPLASAAALGLTLGKKIAGAPLLIANLPAGIGQAAEALQEEHDRLQSIAYDAEANGNLPLAKAYRDVADKLKPENNLKIIHTAGPIITALDSASDVMTVFSGVPKHLLDDVKKGLYSKFITTVSRKAALGLASEGFTEAVQDFVADIGVIKAKGLDVWLDSYKTAQSKNFYVESFAGGAVPGAVLGGGSAVVQQAGSLVSTKGTAPGTEETLPEITVTQGGEPATTAVYGADNKITELSAEFKTALQDYLANPENTFRKKDYPKIAETFGISVDAVPEHLDAAAQEGLVRKDPNGVYRRPAQNTQETIIPETNEAMGAAPIYPEPTIKKDQAPAQEVPLPDNFYEEYDSLNNSIVEDTQRVRDLRTSLKNATAKQRQGMKFESAEVNSLQKKLAKDKKRLEELDGIQQADKQRLAYRNPQTMTQDSMVQALASAIKIPAPTVPDNIDQQYANLEATITSDRARRDTLNTALKNASAKKRRGMDAERKERDALSAKIIQDRKQLEALDEVKNAKPKPKPSRPKLTPQTGKTLLNYLIDSGGITVPSSYAGDTRSIYKKAKSLLGNDIPRRLIMPEGRSIDNSGLWDDLVAEGYIPPYLDPNGGPNLYDPPEKITDLLFEEIGGKKVYSSQYERTNKPDKEEIEKSVLNAAQSYHEEAGIPFDLTQAEIERLVELTVDQGYEMGAALERIAIEGNLDDYNADAASEQSATRQEPGIESQGPGNQTENSQTQQASGGIREAGTQENGTGTEDTFDVIPFSIFRNQKKSQANKTVTEVQAKLKEALEQFKKIAPEGTDLKIFDKTLNNLSTRLQNYINSAEQAGGSIEAAYDPVEDIIVLSEYGSNPTGLVSHEVVHALQRNGLLTRDQIKKLAESSVKLGVFTKEDVNHYRKLYRNAYRAIPASRLNQIIEEEAAARLIQSHAENKTTAPKYKKILDRIAEFLRMMRRAFGGSLKTNDIVDMILNGDAAKGKLGKYVTNQDLSETAQTITASLERKDRNIAKVFQEAEEKVAEKPNPLTAPVRGSIPLVGNTVKPISAATANMMRLSEGVNEKGVFAPRAELADWMGLPMVRFQGDVKHFAKKLKTTTKQAKQFVAQVLDNAQFAYKYKNGENWNIVYVADRADHIVSIAPKLTGRPGTDTNLSIVKAFKVRPSSKDAAIVASIQDNGIEGIRWKKDVDGVDRILNIVRQSSGPNEHPSVQNTIKELNKEQALLRGVKPEILAAIGKSANGRDVKGITNIIRDLASGLGITLKQGGGPSWGYQPISGVIRNKAYYDYSTFVQSLAPYFESKYNWVLPLQMQHSTELGPLDPQTLDPAEGFKIWMELYLTDRTMARQRAPSFTQEFEDFLEVANPTYLANLQAAQIAYEEYTNVDPVTAIESSITPAERTTMFSQMSKEFKESGAYSTIKHYLLAMYANTIAKEAPLSSAVRKLLMMELEKTGQKRWLKAIENPAKLFLMVPQAQQMATMDIKNGIQLRNGRVSGPGLPEVLRKALGDDRAEALDLKPGSRYSHFLTYLVSLRGKQLWEQHLAGELERPPLAVSYQVATRAIQDLETRYPDFVQAQQMMNQFTRAFLRLKYESGFMNTETFNELLKDKFYIPFERSFDEEVTVAFKEGKGKSVNVNSLLKRIKGSKRDVIDPVSILCKDVYSARNVIVINDTLKALVSLAEEIGPEAGSIIERVNSKEIVADLVHIEQIIKTSAKDAGLTKLDSNNLIQHVAGKLGVDAIGTAFKAVSIRPGTAPIIPFLENGQLQAMRINDPQLAKLIFDSMNYLGSDFVGMIGKILAVPAQITRATVTTNPVFIVGNTIRDAFQAPAYDYKMIPFVSQYKGYKLYKDEAFREKYIRAGGIMGGVGSHGLDKRRMDEGVKKLVNLGYEVNSYSSLSDWWRAFQTKLELSETFTRMSLFKNSLDTSMAQGLSEMEALAEAQFHSNGYCDYSRHGIRARAFTKMTTFFNAALQSLDTQAKLAVGTGDYGSTFKEYFKYKLMKGAALTPAERQKLKQSFVSYVYQIVFIGGVSYAIWLYNQDDDRLDDVDGRIRKTHWVVPVGKTIDLIEKGFPEFAHYLESKGLRDTAIRIPKPWAYAAAANLIERYLRDRAKGDPNWLLKSLDDFYDTVVPPMRPAFIDYAMIYFGKDPNTWKDIEPESLKKLEPSERFTPYTSEFSKALGREFNISPIKLDLALSGAGTSWFQDFKVLNFPGLAWYNPNKPELRLDEFVFARRFLWRVGKNTESGRIVREMMGEENVTKSVFQRLGVPYSNLNMKSQTYQEKLKKATLDDANRYLATASKRERGFAILMAGSEGRQDAKFEKLDPINRASIIGKTSFNIQREIASGTLTQDKGKKKENRVSINSQSKLQASEILLQIQGQEAHNALVLTQEPGYAKRVMFDTSGLYKELELADPEIHKEFTRRLKVENVMSWEGTKQIWPDLKEILESDEVYQEAQRGHPEAVDRQIRAKGLYFRAKYPSNGEQLEAQ